MLVRYQAEDKPNTVQPTSTRGVSSLLQGSKSVIIPENNERMARRQLHLITNHNEAKGDHNKSCCDSNGNRDHYPEYNGGARGAKEAPNLAEELVALTTNDETYHG
jgi:lysine 2,3-aminomutase